MSRSVAKKMRISARHRRRFATCAPDSRINRWTAHGEQCSMTAGLSQAQRFSQSAHRHSLATIHAEVIRAVLLAALAVQSGKADPDLNDCSRGGGAERADGSAPATPKPPATAMIHFARVIRTPMS